MAMIHPVNANCPYCGKVDLLCCRCCGACDDHAHVTCEDSAFCMVAPQTGTCASCGLDEVLCCSDDGSCGVHNHAH